MNREEAYLATLEQLTHIEAEVERDWFHRRREIALNQIGGACAQGKFEVFMRNVNECGRRELCELGFTVRPSKGGILVSWRK